MTLSFRAIQRHWGRLLVPAVALAIVVAASALGAPQRRGSQTGASDKSAAPDAKGKDQAKSDSKSKAKAEAEAKDAKPTAAEASATATAAIEERFKDPRAVAAMENKFPELYAAARSLGTPDAERRMVAMASTPGQADRSQMLGYVQAQVAQLTQHTNIDSMLNPGTDSARAHVMEDAGGRLLNPLLAAIQSKNTAFRTEFTRALLTVAPEVMKNHLYARMMLMLALSRCEEPLAREALQKLLDDPDQPISVKLLAALGMSSMAETLSRNPGDAMRAAKAVGGFLNQERDSFWPAQIRGFQALGNLRQASTDALTPKADLEAVAMTYLADPKTRPDVRAWASWALGMMRPNPKIENLNFVLIAYHMASAAADIGAQIAALNVNTSKPEEIPPYLVLVSRKTDLLLQLDLGLEGDPGIRDAGLLKFEHAGMSKQKQAVSEIAAKVKAMITAAIELSRSAGVQVKDARAALTAAVDDLKAFLAANPPADAALYPGGPSFPPAAAPSEGSAGR